MQPAFANILKNSWFIADKGYFSGQDIQDTKDASMIPLVPKGDTSGSEKKGIFNRSEFKIDAAKDVYICPENKELQYHLPVLKKAWYWKNTSRISWYVGSVVWSPSAPK